MPHDLRWITQRLRAGAGLNALTAPEEELFRDHGRRAYGCSAEELVRRWAPVTPTRLAARPAPPKPTGVDDDDDEPLGPGVPDDDDDKDGPPQQTTRLCPVCNGKGRDHSGRTCLRCGGRGRVAVDDVPGDDDEDEEEAMRHVIEDE